jgi:hypothetical protein
MPLGREGDRAGLISQKIVDRYHLEVPRLHKFTDCSLAAAVGNTRACCVSIVD